MRLHLALTCPVCGSAFERDWRRGDGQVRCPQCGAVVCPCGCGADMRDQRIDAIWRSDACRKRVDRAHTTDKARTGIRSGNVRSVEAAAELHEQHKEVWTRRVLEGIARALDARGEYHADDLAHLEIPAAHVNIIGSQVMRLVNAGVIRKAGMRRNSSAASNARWSGVYVYAPGGRERLRKLIAGAGAGASEPQDRTGAASPSLGASADSGDQLDLTGEPQRLFEPQSSTSMYDPYSEAA